MRRPVSEKWPNRNCRPCLCQWAPTGQEIILPLRIGTSVNSPCPDLGDGRVEIGVPRKRIQYSQLRAGNQSVSSKLFEGLKQNLGLPGCVEMPSLYESSRHRS